MSKHYKALTHTRAFAQGDIVTAEQIKEHDLDVDDLVKRHAIEETTEKVKTDTPGIPTNEQNNLNIEKAIRDKTAEQGRPMTMAEQDALAAEVTKDSGRPLSGKDIGKAEKLQAQQRKADEKAAAAGGPQSPR